MGAHGVDERAEQVLPAQLDLVARQLQSNTTAQGHRACNMQQSMQHTTDHATYNTMQHTTDHPPYDRPRSAQRRTVRAMTWIGRQCGPAALWLARPTAQRAQRVRLCSALQAAPRLAVTRSGCGGRWCVPVKPWPTPTHRTMRTSRRRGTKLRTLGDGTAWVRRAWRL